MRKILFRGKRDDDGLWVYGWYSKFVFSKWPLKDCIIPKDDAEDGCLRHEEVNPSTIGQYIGLIDKNGVKIFEGDIVRTKYGRICIIRWFSPKLCWDMVPINTKDNLNKKAPTLWDLWHSDNIAVIGNIHDNKELLREEG